MNDLQVDTDGDKDYELENVRCDSGVDSDDDY